MGMMHTAEGFSGVVSEARGGMYEVTDSVGAVWLCRTFRGTKTRNEGTSLVAVGDVVDVVPTGEGGGREGVITLVGSRKSALCRKRDVKRNRSKEKTQVIAANIDQLAIVASALEPPLNRRLIDRYLVFAESEHLPVLIIVNKVDLVPLSCLEADMAPYRRLGYRTAFVSASSGAGLAQLVAELQGRVSAFSGHSGVGKSTLINLLLGDELQKTAALSEGNSRGVHTTTNAAMLPLPGGGYVIDTPGIREFSLSGISRENLRFWFPEFLGPMQECSFSSCSHTREPGCAVRSAAETGDIDASRYDSYLALYESLEDEG
ncbi:MULTISPECIES: ribosome small subunit-dependent GTPase A [Prosthecochloris]|uniref:Small ribosomal subunit biogenesis GTPase RsgA n=1 Tax=Prosthecochloris vibrioformis TaxID=1098 RepID=A0A5C4S3Q4_PROVB|nr:MULTISPECIES: ribosome small subunit-dependent GTPase A [Prosthecochloris]ANT65679.1 Putative ribosome biogenesis GTPase RsgA [Prosthecochloris sp. CIB 2401]TNJ37945.1 ribosome small subunit-dependent GTPase A [Prosthecochloris vibrioformis]